MRKNSLLFIFAALVLGAMVSFTSCTGGNDSDIPIVYGIDSSRIGQVTEIERKPGSDSARLHFKFSGSEENHSILVPLTKADSLKTGGPIKITKKNYVIPL